MPEGPSNGARALRVLLVAGFYVAITLVFFKPTVLDDATFSTVGAVQRAYLPWQVTHENGRPFFPQSDQAQSFYPRQVFIDRAVTQGELPAWDPYTFAGHPYLSNGGNSFFYPPRQLVTRLAGPALAHDLYLMLHMALGGCATYLLLRELRFSTAASLLGGLAWAWNPFAMAWAQLELLPPVMAWFPLALTLVHRADRRQSWPARIGAGGICGLMLLGGSLDLGMAATAATLAYATALAVRRAWRVRRDRARARVALTGVGHVGAVATMAVTVGAPAVLPFLQLSVRFARTPMDYDIFVSHVAVPIRSFWDIWWHPEFPITVPIMHSMGFAGTLVAGLAVVGIVQRRAGTALARSLLIGSVLVLGRTPLVAAFDALSSSYRFLSLGRFMYGWALGMVILAAAGFDRLAAALVGREQGQAGERTLLVDPLELVRRRGWRRSTRQWLALAAFGVMVLGTGAQLFRYDRAINPDFTPRDRSWLFPETPLIQELLRRQTAPAADRNLPIVRPGRQPLPDSSIPLVFPFESAAGYDSALPSAVAGLWRVVMGESPQQVAERGLASGLVTAFPTDRTRFDLIPRLGITSVLAPNDLEDEPGWDEAGRRARGLVTMYDGRDGDLLEVLDPAPRAYIVHQAEVEADPQRALERFTEASFPWRSTVLLDRHPLTSERSPERPLYPATVIHHGLTEVTVEAEAAMPGYLVLLDSYDEGWSATVNGRAAPVLRANAAFRAVAVPAGASKVVFRYETPGLDLGLMLAAGALIGGGGVAVGAGVRSRGRRAAASPGLHGEPFDDALSLRCET